MGGPPHINQGFGETITRILPTGIDGFGTLWIQSPDCNKAATSTLYGVRIPLSSPAGLRDADISSWVISLTSIKTFAGSERASLSISEFFSGISSFATFHLALPSTPIICNAKEYASWSSSAYTISTEARGPSPRILKKPGPSIERGPTRLRRASSWRSVSAVFFCAFNSAFCDVSISGAIANSAARPLTRIIKPTPSIISSLCLPALVSASRNAPRHQYRVSLAAPLTSFHSSIMTPVITTAIAQCRTRYNSSTDLCDSQPDSQDLTPSKDKIAAVTQAASRILLLVFAPIIGVFVCLIRDAILYFFKLLRNNGSSN